MLSLVRRTAHPLQVAAVCGSARAARVVRPLTGQGRLLLSRTFVDRRCGMLLGATGLQIAHGDAQFLAQQAFTRAQAGRGEHILALSVASGLRQKQEAKSTLGRLWRALLRLGYLGSLIVPGLVLAPVALGLHRLMPALGSQDWILSYGLWAIESAGPTFIKLIQWAATRPDLFPEALVAKFAHLADSVTAHPWSATVKTLEHAFGNRWREDLELEEAPIGSGCIAQVYRGKARRAAAKIDETAAVAGVDFGAGGGAEGGDEWIPVAVKLIHPHVKDMVEVDMDILTSLAWKLQQYFPSMNYLSLYGLACEFSDNLQLQLDLRVEANNLDRFNEHFKDNDHVKFPHPVAPWVTEHALVESFCAGDPITQWMKSDDTVFKKAISDSGTAAVLKMIFDDNLVHGDLHPGNILVTRVPGDPVPVLSFLDAGIVTDMDRATHKQLVDICLAFLKRDGYLAGELMVEYSDSLEVPRNKEEFCKGIRKMQVEAVEDDYFEKFGEYWATTCNLACDHRVKINSKFLAVGLALRVVEGVNLHLDPKLDVVEAAVPCAARSQARYAMEDVMGAGREAKKRVDRFRRSFSKVA
jgi:aarF domain-containing kinase